MGELILTVGISLVIGGIIIIQILPAVVDGWDAELIGDVQDVALRELLRGSLELGRVWPARLRTSVATTAKPRPASPAIDA